MTLLDSQKLDELNELNIDVSSKFNNVLKSLSPKITQKVADLNELTDVLLSANILSNIKSLSTVNLKMQKSLFDDAISKFYPNARSISDEDSKFLNNMFPLVDNGSSIVLAAKYDASKDAFSLHKICFDVAPPPLWDPNEREMVFIEGSVTKTLSPEIYSEKQLAVELLKHSSLSPKDTIQIATNYLQAGLKNISNSL